MCRLHACEAKNVHILIRCCDKNNLQRSRQLEMLLVINIFRLQEKQISIWFKMITLYRAITHYVYTMLCCEYHSTCNSKTKIILHVSTCTTVCPSEEKNVGWKVWRPLCFHENEMDKNNVFQNRPFPAKLWHANDWEALKMALTTPSRSNNFSHTS